MFSKVHHCCYSKDVLFCLIIIISFIFITGIMIIFIIHNLYNDSQINNLQNYLWQQSYNFFPIQALHYFYSNVYFQQNSWQNKGVYYWQYWSCHLYYLLRIIIKYLLIVSNTQRKPCRGFINIFSKRATSGFHRRAKYLNWTIYKKSVLLDSQTRQATSSLQVVNLPGAQMYLFNKPPELDS